MTLRVKYSKTFRFILRLRSSRMFIIQKPTNNYDPVGGRINNMKIILFHAFAFTRLGYDAKIFRFSLHSPIVTLLQYVVFSKIRICL